MLRMEDRDPQPWRRPLQHPRADSQGRQGAAQDPRSTAPSQSRPSAKGGAGPALISVLVIPHPSPEQVSSSKEIPCLCSGMAARGLCCQRGGPPAALPSIVTAVQGAGPVPKHVVISRFVLSPCITKPAEILRIGSPVIALPTTACMSFWARTARQPQRIRGFCSQPSPGPFPSAAPAQAGLATLPFLSLFGFF